MDSRKRHAIDEWAMLKARQYYESLGYALKDTSRNSPFDFLATSNGYQRRLEVKGLTGCVGPVIVTAGEVRAARDLTAKTDLVLVHDIVLLETAPGVFQGEGGAVHVISDWRAEDDHLKPLQYEYSV